MCSGETCISAQPVFLFAAHHLYNPPMPAYFHLEVVSVLKSALQSCDAVSFYLLDGTVGPQKGGVQSEVMCWYCGLEFSKRVHCFSAVAIHN